MKIDYSYHYRKWHKDTPEHVAATTAYYQRILSPYLPVDKSGPILDVGCGMGFTMLALKALGYQDISGIDTDEGQVASCKAKGLNVIQCPDSAAFLRQNPNRFQAIMAFDLMEHIPPAHHLEFAGALFSALKPGGKVMGTTPNANASLMGRYRYLDWTHQTIFTEHSIDFLMHQAGFAQTLANEVEYFTRPKLAWLPRPGLRHWYAFRFFRIWRRLEMMAELGPDQGRQVPLSLNLFFVSTKPST